jgi:hypothetical protein
MAAKTTAEDATSQSASAAIAGDRAGSKRKELSESTDEADAIHRLCQGVSESLPSTAVSLFCS